MKASSRLKESEGTAGKGAEITGCGTMVCGGGIVEVSDTASEGTAEEIASFDRSGAWLVIRSGACDLCASVQPVEAVAIASR